MWERIGSSSAVIIGAIVLFLLFTITLFLLERKCEKRKTPQKKRSALYIVPASKRNRAA